MRLTFEKYLFIFGLMAGLLAVQVRNWQTTIGWPLRLIIGSFFTFHSYMIMKRLTGLPLEGIDHLLNNPTEPIAAVLLVILTILGLIGMTSGVLSSLE